MGVGQGLGQPSITGKMSLWVPSGERSSKETCLEPGIRPWAALVSLGGLASARALQKKAGVAALSQALGGTCPGQAGGTGTERRALLGGGLARHGRGCRTHGSTVSAEHFVFHPRYHW